MAGLPRLGLNVIAPALLRMGLVAAAAVGVGTLFGAKPALWFAVAAFGVLLLIHLYYLSALGAWLEQPRLDTLPEGIGSWAEVFSRLYRSRRASDQNERRLSDNEERFRRTISALPEGIVLIDAALQIEWCNPVAERHLGLTLRADQGLRITNLVRDPAFVGYMVSGHYAEPLLFRPLAQPLTALSVVVIEFEPSRSIVISRDVTQSERLDAMRRDFVANVSHELRTPLTVINGFLETLLDSDALLDDLRRRHLQLMQEQAGRMHRLVEDLLTLSRLESGDTPLIEENVDLSALARELVDEARALSSGGIRCPARSRLDGSWSETGTNYAARSATWCPTPCATRRRRAASCCVCGAMPRVVSLRSRISGIGIAPDHIPRLTERFYRVDKGRSRETGGTGLGLAIVKHVLLRHQARLETASQVGVGSTFTVHLPRRGCRRR